MPSLGERLAYLRNQRGLSQAELARLLHMGQSTIAMYEKNRRSPDNQSLKRLADFFGVSTDYLLGRTDRPYGTGGEGAPGNAPHDAKLYAVAADPLFADLLRQVPDLTEEEKQSLVEHWEWALRFIKKERERRRKREEGNRKG
ncbi:MULTISPECIES: helix-turn-helix domain-containing protein [Desulfofundulus]|jgi:transcriptional regulator with XRE-family HTH domain|uniref:Helix-turn-helix domain protein n=1 Tax=Desulfofundulus kuznetsovii (strain DSM 6115 / VKM B-1805 / 17) TaxID=760568 RepID=A0AAU8PAI9_DESK7|nr:helix-turn-helix transcriptional regulator [Desulfofundulus thermocisternus]AEG13896.1 helix-turn-helix domain protein [Desulfofundulus kuznetsovii DSM 6115]MCS5696542.1 helix-turn-helix domain-containing protein [Desulfofundulus thermocisternus]